MKRCNCPNCLDMISGAIAVAVVGLFVLAGLISTAICLFIRIFNFIFG